MTVGYVKHQAILVTWWTDDNPHLTELRAGLKALAPDQGRGAGLLQGPFSSLTNGYKTVVLIPDGSKEGWDTSDLGDKARQLVIEHFRRHVRWADIVEVSYGGDYGAEFPPIATDQSAEGRHA